MTVTIEYASTHFAELVAAADAGEEVEITRPNKPTVQLVVSESTPKLEKFDRSGMFGDGKGKFVLPADWDPPEANEESSPVDSSVPAPVKQPGQRILGAGRGELRVPSWEEWQAMDLELARQMNESPLFPSDQP